MTPILRHSLFFRLPSAILALLLALAFPQGKAVAAAPGRENDFQGRRVLIIGIDGCRRDVMQQAIKGGTAPHFAMIAEGGQAFWNMEAGGEPDGERTQPTISGPGWSTLFTGVFANKHGVLGNGEKFAAGHFQQYPHYFRYLREAKPSAWLGSIVGSTWPEVNKILVRSSGPLALNCLTIAPPTTIMDGQVKRTLNDANVAQEAIRCLSEENPDVLFLHFLDVDHAGHQFGFDPTIPQYSSTLEKLDESVGAVLGAMKKRPKFEDESWLIVVTTDHGGVRRNHGGQNPEEREIFTFFNGPGFGLAEMVKGKVFQTLVAPTVINFLGVPINPAWGFESDPVKPDIK